MLQIIKLDIYENDRIIDTIETDISIEPVDIIKSLEGFRQAVNEKLTQKIEDDGSVEEYIEEELSSSEDEDVESENCGKPKKRKT